MEYKFNDQLKRILESKAPSRFSKGKDADDEDDPQDTDEDFKCSGYTSRQESGTVQYFVHVSKQTAAYHCCYSDKFIGCFSWI